MPETTITEQVIREAPEIEALKLGLMESGKTLADIPLTLPTQQIAGLDPLYDVARTRAQAPSGIGGYQDYLTTGFGTLGTGLGALDPARAAAEASTGLYQPSDLSAYTNPFQQQVIEQTLAELDRQGQIQQNQLAAQGVGAGAFGGSRFGVAEAELGGRQQEARARILADLNAQNYSQALQSSQTAFENQQARQQQASQLFSGIGGLAAGIGGQQLGAAELAQRTGLGDIDALRLLGTEARGVEQERLGADYANQLRQLMEPQSRVAFLSDIYRGAPSSQTILGSQVAPSAPQPGAFQQLGGLGVGLLGTAAAAKQVGGLFS